MSECKAEPRIEEVVTGFLTVTCPGCGLNYTVAKR